MQSTNVQIVYVRPKIPNHIALFVLTAPQLKDERLIKLQETSYLLLIYWGQPLDKHSTWKYFSIISINQVKRYMGSWSSAAFHISQRNHENVEKASGGLLFAHGFNLHPICQIASVEIVFNYFYKPSQELGYSIWGAEVARRSNVIKAEKALGGK